MATPSEHERIREAASSGRLLRAADLGVSEQAMARMARERVLARVVPGVYLGCRSDDGHLHLLVSAAAWTLRHPGAVIGLRSACDHHQLLPFFTEASWLCVPKGASVPRSRRYPLRVVQVAPRLIDPAQDADNGIETVAVHGVAVRVTGPDRTVLDLWRHPKVPRPHALAALHRRVRTPGFDLAALQRLTRRLRVGRELMDVALGISLG